MTVNRDRGALVVVDMGHGLTPYRRQWHVRTHIWHILRWNIAAVATTFLYKIVSFIPMAIQQLLPLAVVLIMAFISSNALPEPNLGTPVETQEGFPGHVALRPDYAVWNIVKMLRNFMDSNADRPVRRDSE
ncbi:unnamed protein product [Haemonchus placei]|uniref:PhoLip_ATPase_C domain-containing protein n=1 Tax=Haemonchus placei TaxID=6290 RepID=A0A0N4WUI1_HAEPC|nr:unnamed protein product [Haemonchus placei]